MSVLYTTLPVDISEVADEGQTADQLFSDILVGIAQWMGVNGFNPTPDEAYAGSLDGRNSRLIKLEITEVQQ